jgi:uncharacterized protein
VIPATREQQQQLVQLQDIDSRIRQLEHRRTNLPEQKALDENASTLQAIAADYASTKEELEVAERRQKHLEGEISTVESRRKSEEGRMYSGLIASQKELEALRSEIVTLKGRKSDLEDELLEVMERVEDLSGRVESLKARHEELTGRVAELTKARDEAATEIDAALGEQRAEREQAAGGVDSELLSTYKDLRYRKGGIAVAQLDGRTCTGCRIELTAIELVEVGSHAASGIAKCAQCDRLLIVSA